MDQPSENIKKNTRAEKIPGDTITSLHSPVTTNDSFIMIRCFFHVRVQRKNVHISQQHPIYNMVLMISYFIFHIIQSHSHGVSVGMLISIFIFCFRSLLTLWYDQWSFGNGEWGWPLDGSSSECPFQWNSFVWLKRICLHLKRCVDDDVVQVIGGVPTIVVFRWRMPRWRTIVMANGHLIVLMWMSWWYRTIQKNMVLSEVFFLVFRCLWKWLIWMIVVGF